MVDRGVARIRRWRLRRRMPASASGDGRSRARWLPVGRALAVTLLGAVCLGGLASFAGARGGRSLDESLLKFFDQQAGDSTLLQFADLVNGSIVAIALVWCGALVTVALGRLRDRTAAVAVVALVVGSVVASEVLKTLIAVHHDALGASLPVSLEHTWPSTHAAAGAGLAMASFCVLRSPRWAALGWAAATIISLCLVMAAAHFPSDVLAGWLVACCSMALVSLIVSLHRHAWSGRKSRRRQSPECHDLVRTRS
jgi:membrane-associated phospholipid phosphatase